MNESRSSPCSSLWESARHSASSIIPVRQDWLDAILQPAWRAQLDFAFEENCKTRPDEQHPAALSSSSRKSAGRRTFIGVASYVLSNDKLTPSYALSRACNQQRTISKRVALCDPLQVAIEERLYVELELTTVTAGNRFGDLLKMAFLPAASWFGRLTHAAGSKSDGYSRCRMMLRKR